MEAEVKGVGGTIKTKGTSLLASLGPYAGALSMLRRMQTKKGAVSNLSLIHISEPTRP